VKIERIRENALNGSGVERAYQLLVSEEDARVCKDIEDRACRVVPGNFLLQIITQFFTKLGDAIANPKTILAWLLGSLGAPALFTAFLVPIRESGSMVPQLFIASYVRQQSVRKWIFVVGCLLQAAAVFSMAAVALFLTGVPAGLALLAALTVFSLSRGLCSVASKDVLGKTVPKTRRGRISGWSEFIAGLVTIGVGAWLLIANGQGDSNIATYLILLSIAGGLWLLASLSYALIREYPGATDGGGNAVSSAIKRLDLLRSDPPFRQFVIARALLLCSALSAPFFILLARENTEGALLVLGLFVIADGLASLVSAPFWGRFADQSSRRVMIWAGAGAAGTGIVLVLLTSFSETLAASHWLYPLFFFLLMIAHSGVRLGRKTYVVDLAGGNKRTDYIAVSNTIIGVLLLITGLIGFLTEVVPLAVVILILALMGLAGAFMSARLPEISDD